MTSKERTLVDENKQVPGQKKLPSKKPKFSYKLYEVGVIVVNDDRARNLNQDQELLQLSNRKVIIRKA